MELLVSAGLSPAQVLRSATSLPADRVGDKDIGRIAPGTIADLVVLGADPEKDVAALRDVRAVYLNGLPLDRDHLLDTPAGSWSPDR
jgi:imidazolonepropionase-like amidohydrolase